MDGDMIGFICAVILALLVLAWIAYCMFVRERHKSEYYQYDIHDLAKRQNKLAELAEVQAETKDEKKGITAGIFILPSRHKNKDDDYIKRPDYPESPAHTNVSISQLIDIIKEDSDDAHYRGICEVDSSAACHSDV